MGRRRLMGINRRLPDEYQEILYVYRPSGAGTGGYNTTGYKINMSANVRVEMGIMATAQQPDSYGYPIACRQNSGDNTIGYGVNVNQATTSISSWNGALATIQPNGGESIRNNKYDMKSIWTPTGVSISDGTNTDSITSTPRNIYSNLTLFGLVKANSQLSNAFVGRIYYCRIFENDVIKVNMIPCIRISDSAVGFYDTESSTFRTSGSYQAGPAI